jgi:hypothetical protein
MPPVSFLQVNLVVTEFGVALSNVMAAMASNSAEALHTEVRRTRLTYRLSIYVLRLLEMFAVCHPQVLVFPARC